VPDYTTGQPGGQDGSSIGGGWVEAGTFLQHGAGTDGWIGLVFDFQRNTEGERGLLLEPPLLNSLTLTLVRSNVGAMTGELQVWYVPEMEPAAYATARLPGTRSEVQLSTTGAGFDLGAGAGDVVRLTVLAPPPAQGIFAVPNTRQDGLRAQLLSGRWRGQLALSVQLVGGSGTALWGSSESPVLAAPTLASSESPFHTGQHNIAHGRRARVRHDPKDGLPYLSDEYVRDGYVEGMMVHPDNWDPVDPPDPHTPPNEGVIRDEVT
jgi:hypothetical protein